jgi:hypothetical protein
MQQCVLFSIAAVKLKTFHNVCTSSATVTTDTISLKESYFMANVCHQPQENDLQLI